MRIRTIKPEFWSHPVMSKQSDAAKLMAIGLLNYADDEGFFFADAKLVRNAIRPMDDDSGITTVLLRELCGIGYIQLKNHATHGEIGQVIAFAAHQVINKPKPSVIRDLFNYGSDTVVLPSGREGNGREQGMEGNEVSSEQSGKPDSSKPSSRKHLPEDEFLAELTRHYPDTDVAGELRKMDAWLLTKPGKQKTRRFVVGWLNRIDTPLKNNATNKQPRIKSLGQTHDPDGSIAAQY